MKNIVRRVVIDNCLILAALGTFRLLFGRWISLALSAPERALLSEQSSFLLDERAFPCRSDTRELGLPWGARSNIRLAYFGRGAGAGLAVSSEVRRLDPDILCQR